MAHETVAVSMPGDEVIEDGNPPDNAMRRQREDVKGSVVYAAPGDENDATR